MSPTMQYGTGFIQANSPEQLAFSAMADIQPMKPEYVCQFVAAVPTWGHHGWYPVILRISADELLKCVATIGNSGQGSALPSSETCMLTNGWLNIRETIKDPRVFSVLAFALMQPSGRWGGWSYLSYLLRTELTNEKVGWYTRQSDIRLYWEYAVPLFQDGYGIEGPAPSLYPAECETSESTPISDLPLPEGTNYSNAPDVMLAIERGKNAPGTGTETTDDVGFSGTQLLIGVAVAAAAAVGIGWLATRKG